MPVDFQCPHCQARTIVEDAYCGQTGPCFSCGKPVSIPEVGRAELLARNMPRQRRGTWLPIAGVLASGLLILGLTVLIGFNLLLPGFRAVRARSSLARCNINLIRIYQALQQYHFEHGSYPPAYTVDANGKPLLSWRVLILPQLNEQELYRQFKLSEPWDSPDNIALGTRMPAVFHCDSDPLLGVGEESSYFVVVGPRTLFPGATAKSQSDIRDDPSQTLMLVECHGSKVHWARPLDVSVAALKLGVNGASVSQDLRVRSEHPDAACVLCADGSIRRLSDLLLTDILVAMSTIDGQESIGESEILSESDSP